MWHCKLINIMMSWYSSIQNVFLCRQTTSVPQRSACSPAGVFTGCFILVGENLRVTIMQQMPAEELSNIHFELFSTHSMIPFWKMWHSGCEEWRRGGEGVWDWDTLKRGGNFADFTQWRDTTNTCLFLKCGFEKVWLYFEKEPESHQTVIYYFFSQFWMNQVSELFNSFQDTLEESDTTGSCKSVGCDLMDVGVVRWQQRFVVHVLDISRSAQLFDTSDRELILLFIDPPEVFWHFFICKNEIIYTNTLSLSLYVSVLFPCLYSIHLPLTFPFSLILSLTLSHTLSPLLYLILSLLLFSLSPFSHYLILSLTFLLPFLSFISLNVSSL